METTKMICPNDEDHMIGECSRGNYWCFECGCIDPVEIELTPAFNPA
jgi:hypothetical protein